MNRRLAGTSPERQTYAYPCGHTSPCAIRWSEYDIIPSSSLSSPIYRGLCRKLLGLVRFERFSPHERFRCLFGRRMPCNTGISVICAT